MPGLGAFLFYRTFHFLSRSSPRSFELYLLLHYPLILIDRIESLFTAYHSIHNY
ncbi:hypothetical protein HMPREF3203_01481 [Proteus mirabilis]|nr:hypothetical protein HMPREF3203_01481 [Proteus mirabilis]